jgi:hypothetical protein
MKHCFTAVAFLTFAIIFPGAAIGRAFDESETTGSAQEIKEAQKTAQHFVKRMQQTRDVSVLYREMFLQDFTSHFLSEGEIVPRVVYRRLTRSDRQRLFAAFYNFAYLSAVLVISEHDDLDTVSTADRSTGRFLLPSSISRKLKGFIPGDSELRLTNTRRLRRFLTEFEVVLAEARAHLKRSRIEQSSEFQRQIAVSRDELGNGLNYRVRVYTGGMDVKDCEPLIGFSGARKFYRVELPLLVGMILVRDGDRMKIVRLTFADGD